jgi:hypothetical protein
MKPELPFILYSKLELFNSIKLDLEKNIFAISPFMLYLYLNPLYSMRGGSTLLADPFMKKPILVFFRLKPL